MIVVVDVETGTWFAGENIRIIDLKLTDEDDSDWFANLSDQERCELGRKYGGKVTAVIPGYTRDK